jgi:hypothetical protein
MECMGAVIALGNKTDHLDEKIEKLEECINFNNKKFENEIIHYNINEKEANLKFNER